MANTIMHFSAPLLLAVALSVHANGVSTEVFSITRGERASNEFRLERNRADAAFNGKALFDNVTPSVSATSPGSFVAFNSGNMPITCVVNNKETLDFVSTLKKGDSVQIKATFETSLFSQSVGAGFTFRDCKLSK